MRQTGSTPRCLRRPNRNAFLRRRARRPGRRNLVRRPRPAAAARLRPDRSLARGRGDTPDARRPGTVGQAIPGIELRIADDGEMLTRGPHVMLGYWQNEAATAEVIRDGWLHTGDLAELDADGFLTIRGRKKELIVLSTGKKVSPTRVEALLTASPLIDQAAVFGDGHCGLTALIVPAAFDSARSEEPPGGYPARNERIHSEITRCLAHAAHEEQIHRFTLLDRPFSIERGELTAKMSLCRNVIARNFAAELNAKSSPSTT